MSADDRRLIEEGILSLMQMPKTVCAVDLLREAHCAFIPVLTHPTTAGVLASFASLGDVMSAEPGALLAFTGPRVVQQTIAGEQLPDDCVGTRFRAREPSFAFGVIAFGGEGHFDPAALTSNTFDVEWPPRSGRRPSH